ncbi:hypothetical protein BU23DRAFT_492837 [Bimuria novae-zelandiae CBS 107.79]|uniref:Uncharacterized protein n=1 Tax=Bimuria novae-zelandiae CBS 107.79 TaxID=1447943 RepID=A0A6A5UK88_9PLEO|nr:hypothetical protein BU23DRAFT_492837 [Bimuria novae-zelandiae CBS 107.79]
MSAQTAATRLRRTFAYPSESDDEDAVETGMDETDRATLLQTLATHDTRTTSTYTHLLLVLPLLPILLYLPLLLRIPTLPAALAAVTSLLASAYTLCFLPLPPVKVSITSVSELQNQKNSTAAGRVKPAAQEGKAERRAVPWVSARTADVLAEWIVLGNAVLCGLLAAVELFQGRTLSEGVTVGGGYLPGVILTVVLFARRELRVVDMSELERLRHGVKNT